MRGLQGFIDDRQSFWPLANNCIVVAQQNQETESTTIQAFESLFAQPIAQKQRSALSASSMIRNRVTFPSHDGVANTSPKIFGMHEGFLG